MSILDEPSLDNVPLLVTCDLSTCQFLEAFDFCLSTNDKETHSIVRSRAIVNSREVIQGRARVQCNMAVHECVLDRNLPARRYTLGLQVNLAIGRPVYRVGVLDGEVVEGESRVVEASAELGLRLWAPAA